MKKTIVFLLFSLGAFPLITAQEVLSFRSRGAGEIIYDDLDLAYDPIELSYLTKTRLYTNLSNLSGNDESILANQPDNEFLLGVSRNKFLSDKLSLSGLFRFNFSKTANPVSLDSDMDGNPDVSGNGFVSSANTVYLDTDGDGIYDTKRTVDKEATNFTGNNYWSFIMNASYRTDSIIWGLKVSSTKSGVKTPVAATDLGTGSDILYGAITGDPDFTHLSTNYLLIKDYLSTEWNESGDFDTKDVYSGTSVQLAMLMPDFKSFELRADLTFSLVNNTLSTADDYKGYVQHHNQDVSDYMNMVDEHDVFKRSLKDNGFVADLGISLRKNLTEPASGERKNQGFWMARADLFYGRYNYENSSESHLTSVRGFVDGYGLLFTDYTQNIDTASAMADEGKRHEKGLFLSGRLNYPLSEKIFFGIGANINISTNNRTTVYSDSAAMREIYIEYDATPANDFHLQSQLLSRYDNHYDISTVRSVIPVGFEYRIGKNNKWAARIGAIYTYTYQTIRDVQQFTGGSPYSCVTTYDNTQVDVVLEDMKTNSTSKESVTVTNTELFTYGFGFYPNENLQIDVLGFFSTSNASFIEADYYRSLLLSFTLKF